MLGRVAGMFKLSEAIGITKAALRNLPTPPPFDVEELAPRFVAMTYNGKPELFDGKLGRRPRAISTAAVSLAGALKYEAYGFDDDARQTVFLALGNLLLDGRANAHRYGFGDIDARLMILSERAYLAYAEATQDQTDAIVGSLDL